MPKDPSKDSGEKISARRSLAARVFNVVLFGSLLIGVMMLILGIGAYTFYTGQRMVKNSISITRSVRNTLITNTDPTKYAERVLEIYKGMSDEERSKVGTKEYYEKFDAITKEPEYHRIRSILNDYMKANIADDIYYAVFDRETSALVYVVDPALKPGEICPPGHWEKVKKREIDRFDKATIKDGAFDIGNTRGYGWMATSGVPFQGGNTRKIGYILADNTLGNFLDNMKWFIINYSVVLIILAALLEFYLMGHLKKRVIEPINNITHAAKTYAEDKKGNPDITDHFSKLGIYTGDEIEKLGDVMAGMEVALNEYEKNLKKVSTEKEKIAVELDLAKRIQEDMLPRVFPPFPDRTDFDVYAVMDPAKEVGGDFYDFFLVDDTHLALEIADVSGKGIPAALFMMVVKSMLQSEMIEGKSPGEALSNINSRICESEHEEMFITVWLGILDLETGVLTASNAGHEYPAIKHSGGEYEILHDKHCFVVGGIGGIKYSEYSVELEPGSKVFIYTDGVPEATDSNKEMFGVDRMQKVLNSVPDADVSDTVKTVKDSVEDFVGDAEQFDDMTMLCVEYKGASEDGARIIKKTRTVVDVTLPAEIENQAIVTAKVDEELEKLECPFKQQAQIDIAIDEIFSNIAKYAYAPGKGDATVKMEVEDDPKAVILTFINSGSPYDPTAQEDPDITLSAEERGIGGLGILMVKKSMDELFYEYKDGQNIFKIKRILE